MSGRHIVSEDQGNDAYEDRHRQGVGDGDPQVSVDVEQQHPDHPRPTTEPTIGLVQVLQEEIGEQGGSYEEKGVHRVLPLGYGLKQDAAHVFAPDLTDVLHVLNMQGAVSKREVMSQYNPFSKIKISLQYKMIKLSAIICIPPTLTLLLSN